MNKAFSSLLAVEEISDAPEAFKFFLGTEEKLNLKEINLAADHTLSSKVDFNLVSNLR